MHPRLEHAFRAFPEAGFLCVALADAALQLGGEVQAGLRLERARGLDLHEPFESHLVVEADLAAWRGDLERAFELYGRVRRTHTSALYGRVRRTHTSARARVHHGWLLEQQGRWEEALGAYGELLGASVGSETYVQLFAEASERWWGSLSDSDQVGCVERALVEGCGPNSLPQRALRVCAQAGAWAGRHRTPGSSDPRWAFGVWVLPERFAQRWESANPADRASSPHPRGISLADLMVTREVLSMNENKRSGLPGIVARSLSVGSLSIDASLAWIRGRGSRVLDPWLAAGVRAMRLTLEWRLTPLALLGSMVAAAGTAQSVIHTIPGQGPDTGLGVTAAGVGDIDGDGHDDFAAGAIGGGGLGRATVYSGATGAPLWTTTGTANGDELGISIAGAGDVDKDGTLDVIVGARQSGTGKGYALVVSGASSSPIWKASDGVNGDRFGYGMGNAGDVNNDGIEDIVIGATMSDVGGPDYGKVQVFSGTCLSPVIYCTAKVNSQNCTPQIGFSGMPSMSSPSPFLVTAQNVINNKNGLLFYGFAQGSLPFQGGWLCAAAPIKRTVVQNSGGNPPPNDCSGTYSFDFNAWAQSGVDSNLYAGRGVYCQYWYRDPQSPSTTGLTDALRYSLCP